MTTLYLPSQNLPRAPLSSPRRVALGDKGGGSKFPHLKERDQGRFSDKCYLTYELISNQGG